MIVHNHPLEWYVNKLKNKEYFSQGMYGDAEWICIQEKSIGRKNAEATIYTRALCRGLRESLNYLDPSFYFSTPKVLNKMGWYESFIDSITKIEFVEKEVWDVGSRLGKMSPFISQLKKMRTCIISNKSLRGLHFLKYDEFIEVSYPNCFSEIESVMKQVQTVGNDCVYLISAGLPAAIIAQRIHSEFCRVFALDLGSIWDAFVRIGSQRGWRRELYADDLQYKKWLDQYKEIL